MRDYHLSLHALRKVKTNQPRASQIGVIIVLSIKKSLCDVLIGRELNEVTPTANGRLDVFDKPWGIADKRRSSDLLWRKPNLDSRCHLKVF